MGHSLPPGPGSFVEPGANARVWSSLLLHGKFPDLCECPKGTLPETRSIDALVNVDDLFWGHYFVDGRWPFFFLPRFFAGAIMPGPSWVFFLIYHIDQPSFSGSVSPQLPQSDST